MARYFSVKDGLFKSSRELQYRVCSQGESQEHSGIAREGPTVTVGRGGGCAAINTDLLAFHWPGPGRLGRWVFSCWAPLSSQTVRAPPAGHLTLIEVFKTFNLLIFYSC